MRPQRKEVRQLKNRLKKFWEEHQTEIAIYSLGFVAGTITMFVVAKKAVDGQQIVAGRIWEDEEDTTRIVLFHRNGSETYLRRNPAQAA
jgi:CRISPR/Cas system-associated endoribonuclease Cas2